MITIQEGDYTPFFRAFLQGVQDGGWEMKPLALSNLGISPEHWLKEAAPGRVRYVWPNDGSRDI